MVDVLEEPFRAGRGALPCRPGAGSRFQQQGVLLVKPIEALLAQRLLSVSVAQRGQMFSGSKVCQRLVGLGVVDGAQPPTGGSGSKACRRPWPALSWQVHLQLIGRRCVLVPD